MDIKELMSQLADQIERTANVRAVFGEPIKQGNEIVIPVARVSVRGGGGGGLDKPNGLGEPAQESRSKAGGMGLGMNISTSPVGYIKQGQRGTVFVPVVDFNRIGMAALGLLGLTLWIFRKTWVK